MQILIISTHSTLCNFYTFSNCIILTNRQTNRQKKRINLLRQRERERERERDQFNTLLLDIRAKTDLQANNLTPAQSILALFYESQPQTVFLLGFVLTLMLFWLWRNLFTKLPLRQLFNPAIQHWLGKRKIKVLLLSW